MSGRHLRSSSAISSRPSPRPLVHGHGCPYAPHPSPKSSDGRRPVRPVHRGLQQPGLMELNIPASKLDPGERRHPTCSGPLSSCRHLHTTSPRYCAPAAMTSAGGVGPWCPNAPRKRSGPRTTTRLTDRGTSTGCTAEVPWTERPAPAPDDRRGWLALPRSLGFLLLAAAGSQIPRRAPPASAPGEGRWHCRSRRQAPHWAP
jgi:hypothetical protein